jgi:hypothetical protein
VIRQAGVVPAMTATFPMRSTREIVEVLHDLEGFELDFTADNIERPNIHKVVPVYMWFLHQTTQLTLKDVMMAAQLQLDTMEYPVSFVNSGTVFSSRFLKMFC